jgi:hypothetical protein
MKKLTISVTIAALSIAALTGCGSEASSNTISSTTAAAPVAAAAPASSAPASTPGAAKFGQTVTFPSGVSVTVTPEVHTASESAAGAIDGKIVYFNVKIHNGSKASINGSLSSSPTVSYGADGTEASSGVDLGTKGGDTGWVRTLLPGETKTARSGVGIPVKDFGDVRVEVSSPDMADDPAIFKGSIK